MKPVSTAADERVDAYVTENVPASARRLMARALLGRSKSPRDAVRAKCLSCSNFAREEAAACTVWKCPLYHLNPYRRAAETGGDE
jgi:hypothetical protein